MFHLPLHAQSNTAIRPRRYEAWVPTRLVIGLKKCVSITFYMRLHTLPISIGETLLCGVCGVARRPNVVGNIKTKKISWLAPAF